MNVISLMYGFHFSFELQSLISVYNNRDLLVARVLYLRSYVFIT